MIELRNVRQNPNDHFRRWFSDDNFDLIVWYSEDQAIYGFQLCYDKAGHEKALTWIADRGFTHRRIEAGDTSPLSNRSPVLAQMNDRSDMARVLTSLRASDKALPVKLRMLVRRKLKEYGQLNFRLPEPWNSILMAICLGSIVTVAIAIYNKLPFRDAASE